MRAALNAVLLSTLLCSLIDKSGAFGGINSGGGSGGAAQQPPAFALSDCRFRATCPADIASIYEFDPSLIDASTDDDEDSTWVAVFRSSNNLPSVLIKDEYQDAMRIATTIAPQPPRPPPDDKITTPTDSTTATPPGVRTPRPVAVARLSPSTDTPGKWVVSTVRCALEKERTDPACDGLSEHAEAIGVCIDELLLYHLERGTERGFDGVVRAKATLVSGVLLEERGFGEVEKLTRDMATHVSCLDDSMERYAERVVTLAAKSSGARDRALRILSCLGRLDREEDKKRGQMDAADGDGDGDDEVDPWAAMKQFI